MHSGIWKAVLSIGLLVLASTCSSSGANPGNGAEDDAGNPNPGSPDAAPASFDTAPGPSDAGTTADTGPALVCSIACYGTWVCDPVGATGSATRYTAEPATGGGCNLVYGSTALWWLKCDGVAENVGPRVCSSADACGGTSSAWNGTGDSLTIVQTSGNVTASQTCRREGSGPAADAGPGLTCWNLGAGASGCAPPRGGDAGPPPADWCDNTGSKIVCSDGTSYEWRCGGSGGSCSCRCNWSGAAKNECAYPASVCQGPPVSRCIASYSDCGFPTVTTVWPPKCTTDADCPSAIPVCGGSYCGEPH